MIDRRADLRGRRLDLAQRLHRRGLRRPVSPTTDAELSGDFGDADGAGRPLHAARRCAPTPTRPTKPRWRATSAPTGIGLCRTEHMFFEGERIDAVREMILADDEAGRRKALAKLLPIQRDDFDGLFREMSGLPVTIRLLDPPLHEFLPHDEAEPARAGRGDEGLGRQDQACAWRSCTSSTRCSGHRGCRLGITYPEITEMQARAIFEAALRRAGQGRRRRRPRSWCRWWARCASSTPRPRSSAAPRAGVRRARRADPLTCSAR